MTIVYAPLLTVKPTVKVNKEDPMKQGIGLMIIWLGLPLFLSGQDLQNRTVIHFAAELNSRWYLAGWSVTNLKTQTLNNTSIFSGLGYRGQTWWLEAMSWKQWNSKGGLMGVDVRFRSQLTKKLSLYAEPAVILSQPAFYEFVYMEYSVGKKFRVGGETENMHQLSKQTFAFGPRIGYSLGKLWGSDLALSSAYRFSPTGTDEFRVYLNITLPRFALTDR